MSKEFISIGIDHGTTNSCIAVMDGNEPRVIRSFSREDVVPSAVYIDKRSRLFVGRPAVEAMFLGEPDDGNGFSGYKLGIGQDGRYEFSAAKRVMSAADLGGTVIGELLRAYREESGEQPEAAVITVPAKFEHSACEGTRKAAQLAGLHYYPQIQEPIAAALAYGFTSTDQRAHWIVFDLGGGTLDVSLVIVRKGQMSIPEEGHAGDNRLGGRKFDREVLAYVIDELKKRYALGGFFEKSPVYGSAWNRLLLACEAAKIRLSQKEEAAIELDSVLCRDERGASVKVEVPITRSQYEKMVAADIERAVHACQLLLAKNRITPKDVDRLILVGGPTKTPYVRQVLADRLGIELDTSIDPMTAVAKGAALYAATIEIPRKPGVAVTVPDGEINLTLEYERSSSKSVYCLVGKVEGPTVATGGLSFEVRRTDGLWSSTPQPIDSSGCFSFDLLLIEDSRPHLSCFKTTILDRSGRILVSQSEPQIWFPYPEARTRLANSLLIGLRGNDTEELVKQGAELPARGKKGYYETTKLIRKGSREDVLRIPILEAVTNLLGSEDSHADCNIHVGTLCIVGNDKRVRRDLPVGTEVQVEIREDESREIRAIAYVPLLDEEFEAVFHSEGFKIDLEELEERFDSLKERLRCAEELQRTRPREEMRQPLETVRKLDVIDGIEKELARAREGEQDAQHRAYRRVLELAGTMNEIRKYQQTARIEKHLEDLARVADMPEAREVATLREDYAKSKSDPEALRSIEEQLEQLDRRLRRKPYFDVLIAVSALDGMRVTPLQLEVFKRADALFGRIDSKGGLEALRDTDIAELTAMHEQIARAYPELPARREKFLNELPEGVSDAEKADIIKARSGR